MSPAGGSSFSLFFSCLPFHQPFLCVLSIVTLDCCFCAFISIAFALPLRHVGLLRSPVTRFVYSFRVPSYHISRSACFTGPLVLNRTFYNPPLPFPSAQNHSSALH
ncbi:hypothetical protein BDV32DRAFT_48674 [Aspergillus pseudonomiae]|uniref:Uncharacterized protein n=1 Tax=Aspergillus pseudonomiae TaxID=1506151 RepID=A0A5N7D7K4_9EURO|nr:uncharacterized protein BDV37DRAFT_163975 [Aspergillus pseudonomiae]KAB8260365.1 hypothetical protein BDV32DRAFT_48674 [Aspergillus pseudonomiae]KAE8402185.1 hypothetical protein BDV37DRAFT_163975 [Aspergillus pseudonomiae]